MSKWYHDIVSKEGHTYHKQVIFPRLEKWVSFNEKDGVLDLGCGQGILARMLPENVAYQGVDLAQPLIEKAQGYTGKNQFLKGDATEPLNIRKKDFSHVFMILSLQNMDNGEGAIKNAARHLKNGGKLILVLNHPCYRIPRQSSWGIDEDKKLQYRRVDRYLSPLEIPIQIHPSKKEKSEKTYSYHHPLSTYMKWLRDAGFVLTKLEEWTSPKVSSGKKGKMENRSRSEFPLFLALEASYGIH